MQIPGIFPTGLPLRASFNPVTITFQDLGGVATDVATAVAIRLAWLRRHRKTARAVKVAISESSNRPKIIPPVTISAGSHELCATRAPVPSGQVHVGAMPP